MHYWSPVGIPHWSAQRLHQCAPMTQNNLNIKGYIFWIMVIELAWLNVFAQINPENHKIRFPMFCQCFTWNWRWQTLYCRAQAPHFKGNPDSLFYGFLPKSLFFPNQPLATPTKLSTRTSAADSLWHYHILCAGFAQKERQKEIVLR